MKMITVVALALVSLAAEAVPLKLCPGKIKYSGQPVSESLVLTGIPGEWTLDVPLSARLQGLGENAFLKNVPKDIQVSIKHDDKVAAEFEVPDGKSICAFFAGTLEVKAGERTYGSLQYVIVRGYANADAYLHWKDDKGTQSGMVVQLITARSQENDILVLGGDHVRENPVAFRRAPKP